MSAFPPPTVCEHPERLWEAEGYGCWSTSGGTSVITGYRCRGCGVWIPKDAADERMQQSVREAVRPGLAEFRPAFEALGQSVRRS